MEEERKEGREERWAIYPFPYSFTVDFILFFIFHDRRSIKFILPLSSNEFPLLCKQLRIHTCCLQPKQPDLYVHESKYWNHG